MEFEGIILDNEKLGIETVFFSENNGVLGYSEGNTVYLNKYYNSNLFLVNKHEVLHLFENSKQFKYIKDIVFKGIDEGVLNKIRNGYWYKYRSLYSKEDISNGVLDNEIVIDIIIGVLPVNLDECVKDAYESIVKEKNVVKFTGKRYLNLIVSNRIKQQFIQLTKWEKIFVNNYYARWDNVLPTLKETKCGSVRETIERELERLYALAEDKSFFAISVDSEELLKKYEREIDRLFSRGKSVETMYMKENKKEILKKMADKYTSSLYSQYHHLVTLIKNSEYEPSFKYLMLNETLTKVYSKRNKENLVDKRDRNNSLKSHLTFNDKILDFIYNNVDDYRNFTNLYFAAIDDFDKSIKCEGDVFIDGIETFNKGRWIKFEGKHSSPDGYIENGNKLAAMVKNTPWCTKEQACHHLENGDFYLFVDYNNDAHIGVKLIGDSIDEVRGIKNENAQELEDEYRDVAIEFLSKNKDIRFSKEWLEKELWNERLIRYCEKIDSNTLSDGDLQNLIHDLSEVSDYKAHYAKCSNRVKLLDKVKDIKNIKKMIAKKYGCHPKKVFIGDVVFIRQSKKEFPYEVVLGDVKCDCCVDCDFSKLKVVLGNFGFNNCVSDSLDSLVFVSGDANFSNSQIRKINKLIYIGQCADFYCAEIESLGCLIRIGGTTSFMNSKIVNISNLNEICEDVHFEGCQINDISGLDSVWGNVYFRNSNIDKIGEFECSGKVIGELKTKSHSSRK